MRYKINDIQHPFRSSGQVPVMFIGGGGGGGGGGESSVLCSMGIACILEAAQSFRIDTEKWS